MSPLVVRRSWPCVIIMLAGTAGLHAEPTAQVELRPSASVAFVARDAGVTELINLVNFHPEAVTLDRWAASLVDSATTTTALDLTVTSQGSSEVMVAPGEPIVYEVIGVLTDDANQGLALFGFDLVFDGGDLPHAAVPTGEPTPGCDDPILNFVVPWGFNNPYGPCPPACGFGGTIIDGELIQIGGAQNTINNTPENAPYPIGPVLLGVAHPAGCGPVVLVTGSTPAPEAEGAYTLYVRNGFANVIKADTTGDPFWAVEMAAVHVIRNLTIYVSERFRSRTSDRDAKRQHRAPRR